MNRILKQKLGFVLFLIALAAGNAAAQINGPVDEPAQITRDQLTRLFQHYPPSLRNVLRIDPSLLDNEKYLSLYPQLAAFLKQHPEIAHNPAYYVGTSREYDIPIRDTVHLAEAIMQPLAVAVVLIGIVTGLTLIVRSGLEYRRSGRVAKAQSELHAKIMDRMTSSEDLLAYIQTPAARQFVETAASDSDTRVGSPVRRILWSVQMGLVIVFGGIGMEYVSSQFQYELAQPFFVLGVLGMTVGAGFIISAGASYALSKHLGLLDPSASSAGTKPT